MAAGIEGHEKVQLHILAVPLQQVGHINAMLKLAQALAAQEGVLVTFGYPARCHGLAQKRNELPDTISTMRVEVVDDGLPLEEEQLITPQLVDASIPIFQNAVKVLLDALLHQSKLPPLCCIISDTFVPWTQGLANAVGLPRIELWTSPAAVYSMGSQLSRLVSDGTLPLAESSWGDSEKKWSVKAPLIDGIPGLPPFPPTDLPDHFLEQGAGLDFMLAAFEHIREAHTILVHSIYELESEIFDTLQANGLPILAIGPLLGPGPPLGTSPSMYNASPKSILSQSDCIQWLDIQRPLSVIYIALGTLANFTLAEIHSLAHGLEAFGHPFLWVVRKDSFYGSLGNVLPQGFLQRTVEKGLGHIISWAPQREVLRHNSIGTFFSHCGWNSTLECMWEGVPIVACPREAEQRSNMRWIVENWKIGVELQRQNDGSFTKEAVERAFKEVFALEGKDGVTFKERALKIKKVVRAAVQKGGTSHTNIVGFIQHLRHG